MHLADPMVQSFNYAITEGLPVAVANINPVELPTSDGRKITIALTVRTPEFYLII